MNRLSFKFIFNLYNFHQVLYNTNKNIYGQSWQRKTQKVKTRQINWDGGSIL